MLLALSVLTNVSNPRRETIVDFITWTSLILLQGVMIKPACNTYISGRQPKCAGLLTDMHMAS